MVEGERIPSSDDTTEINLGENVLFVIKAWLEEKLN
jgi:hypothetical protein